MKCNACDWKRKNVRQISFCPQCGSDSQLEKFSSEISQSETVYLSYPQPVDKAVDNFSESLANVATLELKNFSI